MLLGSCAPNHGHRGAQHPSHSPRPSIELLGFPGCPNTPAMRENLRAALRSIGGDARFLDTDQEALPPGDLRRGWPTPTILVNGADLFGLPAPTAPSMGCRVYDGGVPGAAEIAAALRALPAASAFRVPPTPPHPRCPGTPVRTP